jgi:hypothetical protein
MSPGSFPSRFEAFQAKLDVPFEASCKRRDVGGKLECCDSSYRFGLPLPCSREPNLHGIRPQLADAASGPNPRCRIESYGAGLESFTQREITNPYPMDIPFHHGRLPDETSGFSGVH